MALEILKHQVLCLNKNWFPISMVRVQSAVADFYAGILTAVDPDNFAVYDWEDWVERGVKKGADTISSPSVTIECPQVVVLSRYDRVPQRSLSYSKNAVFKRDKMRCVYCGIQLNRGSLTIDHVIPRSQGGRTSWENCVTACIECNGFKADRTPAQAGMQLRYNAAKPKWTTDRAIEHMAETLMPSWKKFLATKG